MLPCNTLFQQPRLLSYTLLRSKPLLLSTIVRLNSTITSRERGNSKSKTKDQPFTLNITSDNRIGTPTPNINKNIIPSNVSSPTTTTSASATTIPKNEVVRKYVLHCLFTKNNTHFTYCAITEDLNFLKNPQNASLPHTDQILYYMNLPSKVIFSLSTGCLGFRKSTRGEYEAGFQTASRVFELIKEKNLLDKDIEIVMKDFGKGRNAFIAALNGKEGNGIRRAVKKVSDATPLKFGGVRSPRPRRL